eukprot:387333_1
MGPPWCVQYPLERTAAWGIICQWICNILLGTFTLFKLSKAKQVQKEFKILYCLLIFCFIAAPPGYAFGFLSGYGCWFGPNFEDAYVPWSVLFQFGVAGYMYGLAVLNMYFMLRLKVLFQAPLQPLTNLNWMIYIALLLVLLVLPGVTVYAFVEGYATFDLDLIHLGARCIITFNIINTVSNLYILILFIQRMLKINSMMTVSETRNKSNSTSGSSTADNIQMDVIGTMQKQTNIDKNMVDVIMRYFVCALCAMGSGIIAALGEFIHQAVSEEAEHDSRIAAMWLAMIDTTVNLIMIYLQYSFAVEHYKKICGPIHMCIQKKFIKSVGLAVKDKDGNVPSKTSKTSNAN